MRPELARYLLRADRGGALPVRPAAANALTRAPLTWLGCVRMTLEPALALVTYLVVLRIYHERLEGKDLLLCLLVYALMFPGSVSVGGVPAGLARDILARWFVVAGTLWAFGTASRYIDGFYADALLAWVLSVPVVLYAAHRLLPYLAPRLLAIEGLRCAVIVGASPIGLRLAERFRRQPLLGVRFAGFFDDRTASPAELPAGDSMLGRIADLPAWLRHQQSTAVFIALPMTAQPRILQLLDVLRDTTASVYFVPDILLNESIQARIDDIDGLPVVALCESPFLGVSGFAKRMEDLVLGLLILLLIAPLLLLVAIGVKLSSPGPVLFCQRRYGLDGKQIVVYKFRSMRVCEDGERVTQARRGDPRVTRFGAFLRRTSLDELPQFINVLQGRMSIVGPRPHAVAHNELYRGLIGGYMLRHKVKPGITGLAQVSGFRGETDTIDKMSARIHCDLEYLRHWSLQLDLSIILKTFLVVASGRNAR